MLFSLYKSSTISIRVHVAGRYWNVDPKFFTRSWNTRSTILIIFYFECRKRINIIAKILKIFLQAVPVIHYVSCPLDETHLVSVKGLIHQDVSTRVYQRGELNWASHLKPSGQQISSTIMSRPESILIRQD